MEPVRLGVVGCGVIGRKHLDVAARAAQVEVVAVADIDEAAACAVAAQCGVETIYADADMLLADPRVEGVVLAFPTKGRTQVALRAFARGKHVLLEKPVAMNAEEVRWMLAAKGELVAACCSSRLRFLPSADVATEVIAGGALGDIRVVRCRAIIPADGPPETPRPPWRLRRDLNGGGILVNWGCYDLDYLLGITGWALRPRCVLAQTWPIPPQFASHVPPGSDAETHYAALVRFERGAVLTIERGEYMPAAREEAWQVIGSKGSLRLQMTPGQGKQIWLDEATADRGMVTRVIWQGDEDGDTQHAGPILDFASAIRGGHPPKTGLEQALVVQQITDAVYASAEHGRAVKIE